MPKRRLKPGGNLTFRDDENRLVRMRPGDVANVPKHVMEGHSERFESVPNFTKATAGYLTRPYHDDDENDDSGGGEGEE